MNCLLGRKEKGLILGLAALMCCALIPATSNAANVDVYAEGAYTATDLVVYIYADINAGPILSFGVKVNYPATLTYSSAAKNENVWFFGDGTTNHAYMNPEDNGSAVVIIGGKLDTAAPTPGVTGTRVLLGTVTFTHSGVTNFSGVTLVSAPNIQGRALMGHVSPYPQTKHSGFPTAFNWPSTSIPSSFNA